MNSISDNLKMNYGITVDDNDIDYSYKHEINNYLDSINKIDKSKKINLCIYRITQKPFNTSLLTVPYISYLMYKYNKPDLVCFPFVANIKKVNTFLKDVFSVKWKTEIMGFREHDGEIFLFIKVNCLDKGDVLKQQSTDIWWWVLADEIINTKHCMGYDIHVSVTDFFINNIWSLLLFDNENNLLETPSVLYCGDEYNTALFQVVFGLNRRTHWANLGPFIYFSNFNIALKYSVKDGKNCYIKLPDYKCKDKDKDKDKMQSGIIRCVVLGKKQRVFLNANKDPEKELTQIEKLKMKDGKIGADVKKRILKNRKMKDTDGVWSNSYDSAVIADGSNFMQQVIKNRNDYTILNYSEVDRKNLRIL